MLPTIGNIVKFYYHSLGLANQHDHRWHVGYKTIFSPFMRPSKVLSTILLIEKSMRTWNEVQNTMMSF